MACNLRLVGLAGVGEVLKPAGGRPCRALANDSCAC